MDRPNLSRKEYHRRRLRKARLRKRLNRRGYTGGGFVQNEGRGISAKDCLSNGIFKEYYFLFFQESSFPCFYSCSWFWRELHILMILFAAAFSASFQIAPSVQVHSRNLDRIKHFLGEHDEYVNLTSSAILFYGLFWIHTQIKDISKFILFNH